MTLSGDAVAESTTINVMHMRRRQWQGFTEDDIWRIL